MKKINYELCLFYTAAFIGGFFGGYAVMRSDMFASSQTMNILTMMLNLFGSNLGEFLVRFCIMVIYAGAISVCILVPRYTKLDIRIISAVVTAVSSVIMACIPSNATSVLSLLPIFIAMAMQWNAFPGALGYQAACIFVTNNFRQAIVNGINYLCTKEKKYISGFWFYAGDICSFLSGFTVCYIGVKYVGFCFVSFLIFVALFMILLIIKERESKNMPISHEAIAG